MGAAMGRLLLALALLAGLPAAPAVAAAERTVVMISIDGFRHDYLELHGAPNLARLARRGIVSAGLIPVFPSKTFPNHLSIATGLRPGRHGIVDNHFYDRERRALYSMRDRAAVEDGSWYAGEPLWVAAERAGLPTAAFFWVGTEADIGGVRPTDWRRYDELVPGEERVDTVLGWLDRPAATRPRLITFYFSEVDGAGHRHGPESPRTGAAVARVDALIGRFLAGLEARGLVDAVTLVVVSDHGMRAVSEDRVELLPPPPAGVAIQGRGVYVSLDFPSAAAAAAYAAQVAGRMDHARAYRKPWLLERIGADFPARLPDLMVVAEPGWWLVPAGDERAAVRGGAHGYLPEDDPQMAGLFVAAGPGVRAAGRIPAFENIHVHPFVRALLGLPPAADIDGDPAVLAPFLAPEAPLIAPAGH